MSLINRENLIAEYDRAHEGPPGGARKLMVDAPEVKAIPMAWIKKYIEMLSEGRKWRERSAVQVMAASWMIEGFIKTLDKKLQNQRKRNDTDKTGAEQEQRTVHR